MGFRTIHRSQMHKKQPEITDIARGWRHIRILQLLAVDQALQCELVRVHASPTIRSRLFTHHCVAGTGHCYFSRVLL